MKRWRVIGIGLLAEAVLFSFLGGLYYFQIENESYQLINRTMVAVQFYAHQPTPYQSSYSHYFYEFGYPSMGSFFLNPWSPKTSGELSKANMSKFSILMESEILKGSDAYIKQAYLRPRGNKVQKYEDHLALNSVLYREPGHKPYGLVRISHNIRNLPRDVFFKNALLYLVIFLLYNTQLLLLHLYWQQRKKGTIVQFEQGYLKEHALGALKLQHKILGEIIKDHEQIDQGGQKEGHSSGHASGRVIVLEQPRPDKERG